MTRRLATLSFPALPAALLLWGCSTGTSAASDSPTSSPLNREQILHRLLDDFAADSMAGRAAGSPGHYRATAYLARQASEIGLQPAGEEGTYFQIVPITTRVPYSTANVEGRAIALVTDAVPIPPVEGLGHGMTRGVHGVPVVYGGRMFAPDEISAEEGRGKVVVLAAGLGGAGQPVFGVAPATIEKFSQSAAIVLAVLDLASPGVAEQLAAESALLPDGQPAQEGPLLIFVSDAAAQLIVGSPLDEAVPGSSGHEITGEIGFHVGEPQAPTRNVIAVLPGSDPALRDEYVVVSAHSDHLAPVPPVADHDSLRAYLAVVRPRGAEDPAREATPDEAARIADIRAATDGGPRPDSIMNGADDDGSGSVALLEIGRTLRDAGPRRSILFVWHTAEELGLLGSEYFTDHPTVPRESIVADLNSDMIGRGGPEDLAGGGPAYVQLIGSRRLSTQLGDLVEDVNRERELGFTFDYTFDADGHPDNYYCRSDHYMYARYGIPIVFFSTGGHRDYHQLTDEPRYIDYGKLSRVTALVAAVAERVANLDERLVVDGPLPDPDAPCQQ